MRCSANLPSLPPSPFSLPSLLSLPCHEVAYVLLLVVIATSNYSPLFFFVYLSNYMLLCSCRSPRGPVFDSSGRATLPPTRPPTTPIDSVRYRQYPMLSPYALVCMHALKGLACRSRVTPASSHASPCSGEAVTLAARCVVHAEVTKKLMGPKLRYPAVVIDSVVRL